LVELGKAILQLCSVVKGELETIAKPKLLRIGILQSLSSRHVSRLLGSFRRDNPSVAIEMFDGVGEQLIGLLTDRRVDAILTIFDDDYAQSFRAEFSLRSHTYWPFPKLIASRSAKA
jgi:DNA-binding transcriptional LysR family regulator